MSTPDQPDSPPLTRRRLREIRATGSNPVIGPDGTPVDAEPASSAAPEPSPPVDETPEPAVEPTPAPTPLPRAAEPAPVPPAPVADAAIDLGVSPLTRRQARAQERIRTASVPVIQADHAPEPIAAAPRVEEQEAAGPLVDAEPAAEAAPVIEVEPEQPAADPAASLFRPALREEPVSDATTEPETSDDEEQPEPAAVDPGLGSELLAGAVPPVSIPPSFDQLIARNTASTGAISAPNALILSQTPSAAPLGPLSPTGEVMITGSFDLPAGLGSVGHAHGAADGKDLDAALIDGELPPSSSPTPIAASAAISTVRNSGEEIIRPPVPDKGSRLNVALIVIAGTLAVITAGVLVLVFTTGVLG